MPGTRARAHLRKWCTGTSAALAHPRMSPQPSATPPVPLATAQRVQRVQRVQWVQWVQARRPHTGLVTLKFRHGSPLFRHGSPLFRHGSPLSRHGSPLSSFQNGLQAISGFEMCFDPSILGAALGAGAKTRLESRINKFTPRCVYRPA